MKAFLEEYLAKYWRFADYLLLNHIVKIAREAIPHIAFDRAAMPINNTLCGVFGGNAEAGAVQDSELGAKFLEGDSFLYKLSNRAYGPRAGEAGRAALAAELLGSATSESEGD